MFGKVTIGKNEVGLLANAATPYYFNQIFKEDFFVKSQAVSEGNEGAAVDLFSKVGYIMASQAEKADMNKLSIEGYLKWLEDFEPMDMAIASADIALIYSGQAQTTAKAKN